MEQSPITPAPLLSVVTPVYGVEPYLPTCLDSILGEADARVELIAVNDASPDRCGELLDQYARVDPRVRAIHLSANVGLGQARNEGLEHATGTYVWFVDGDDHLPPGAVPAVLERLAATWPDVLMVDHVETFDDGRVEHRRPHGVLPVTDGRVELRHHPHLLRVAQSACIKIARRSFLDEAKLRFATGWYEDISFSHPLLMAAGHIQVINRVCYCYRQRTVESITTSVSPRHFDVFDQYERLFDWIAARQPAADIYVPELFRAMIDHYLVIIGHEQRLPPSSRRDFFRRMAADYRARCPRGGYQIPGGIQGVKHRLVRHDAYRTYATSRRVYRAARRIVTP